ncbi:MAG: hypothetical protein J6L24_04180 [Oscillospiraceae bacterium]|nr:hypothetical protein [Oscillospiraceae bacterium]
MNSYDINYDDKRFKDVESDKQEALSELAKTYSGVIRDTDRYYQAQTDASKEWADEQARLQKENTDFAVEKIEQQKEQARKDYTKEQAGAYLDWQKQSNRYGINAEQLAAAGMSGTGYSESSQVSMYNTYQNRVAAARESYNQAVRNYDNSITEARLQNSSALAEIAYQALQQQLELSLEGFQYKNQLILDQADRKTELDNIYYRRYQDVLEQINTENALIENARQYNTKLIEKVKQLYAKEQESLRLEREAKQGNGGGTGSNRGPDKEILELFRRIELAKNLTPMEMSELITKTSGANGGGNADSGASGTKTGSSKLPLGSTTSLISTLQSLKNIENKLNALGYGPVNVEKFNELISQGIVESYYEDGVQKFRMVDKISDRSGTKKGGTNKVPLTSALLK